MKGKSLIIWRNFRSPSLFTVTHQKVVPPREHRKPERKCRWCPIWPWAQPVGASPRAGHPDSICPSYSKCILAGHPRGSSSTGANCGVFRKLLEHYISPGEFIVVISVISASTERRQSAAGELISCCDHAGLSKAAACIRSAFNFKSLPCWGCSSCRFLIVKLSGLTHCLSSQGKNVSILFDSSIIRMTTLLFGWLHCV